jgi:HK97 family phage prohead protease
MKNRKLVAGQKAYVKMPLKIKSIDKANFILTMVASTQDTDRHGDVVVQSGWILDQFNQNPVILNSHNYYDCTEVIANAIRTEIKGKGAKSRLEQDWKFAVNENPKAKIIFDLYAGGFLHASSVGFIPRKFKENDDGTKDYWTIEEAELLEVSAVSVPANAYALAKSKGIDVDKIIDDEYDHSKTKDVQPGADDTDQDDDEDDEIPPDNEIPPTDGEPTAKDGDDSQGEPAKDDAEAIQDGGDKAGDEIIPEEDKEEVIEPVVEPIKQSYASKVIKAINSMESKKKECYQRAAKIINSLMDEKSECSQLNKEINEQIRKRKVNQAIRELLKTR